MYEIYVFFNEYYEDGHLSDCIQEISLGEYDDYDEAKEVFDKIEKLSKE